MSQPALVCPNPVLIREPISSHRNGSYRPVFIVMAMIVLLSAVACALGRLRSRWHRRTKEAHGHHSKANKLQSNYGQLPKEWESRQKPNFNMKYGDLEFGFDKRIPSAKVANNGGGRTEPPHHNGGHRPQVRFKENP